MLMSNIFENGIDLNKDGHCDLCGKFVDIDGHHNLNNDFKTQIANIVSTQENINDKLDYTSKYLMSRESSIAVKKYATNDLNNIDSSIYINLYLRDMYDFSQKSRIFLDETISKLDKAFQYTVKEQFYVYRGISINRNCSLYKQLINIQTNGLTFANDLIGEKGYLSTSINHKTAIDYLKASIKNHEVGVFMKLMAGKNTKCVPLFFFDELVSNPWDKEVLFPRSSQIYIIKCYHYKTKNKEYFIVEGVI